MLNGPGEGGIAMGTHRSPLDPLVREFLRVVAAEQPGYSPSSRRGVMTAAKVIDVPPELVDALFASSRSRGFLQPVPHGRSRMRWQLSKRGEAFLAADVSKAAGQIPPIETTHR